MNKKNKKNFFLRRLVVKFGTKNLCGLSGNLNQSIFNDFARQIMELQKQGLEIIIVSSGAIKAGRERIKEILNSAIKTDCFDKKELAGIGSRHLMNKWGKAFGKLRKEVAQVWVTFGNWSHQGERRSIQSSIFDYLRNGVIPIINENDVVSDREIRLMDKKISENDRLASMIATKIKADAILFLTDEGGIYEKDPKINPQARLYEEITIKTKLKDIHLSKNISEGGTGGMKLKLKEALHCAKKGMLVAIAGNEKDVILKFARGEPVGTRIRKGTQFKK